MSQVIRSTLFFMFILISITASAKTYYVAPTGGSDSNAGTTINAPWATWQKAFETAQAGDTVYFRGGIWYPTNVIPNTNTVVLHSPTQAPVKGHNGTKENPICFFNYPNEIPILDCSGVSIAGRNFNTGVSFSYSHFIHVRGLQVKNVLQPTNGELACGMGADVCSHMTFENIVVSNIGGRGMTYWGIAGHPDFPNFPTDTSRYINCDVYNCVDLLSEVPGNGSDGWKLDNEAGGYLEFYGCRAWNCGDDGFDISGPGITIFDHCWSFSHRLEGALDGNGFKYGANRGSGAYVDEKGQLVLGTPVSGVRKIVRNCIAANNAGFGLYDLGYDPYYPNNSRVYNNSIYHNGIGIQIATNPTYSGVNPNQYYNNIIYGTEEKDAGGRPYNLSVDDIYLESNNTWKYADASIIGSLPWWQPNNEITVTDDDFISLNWSELSNPRKSDGSLPDITFMKLAPGSDLIDNGVDVGLPYYGSVPDLGYSEYSVGTPVIANPTFVSSAIASDTPSKLEITYSLSLANIVPAISAFTVIVNSSARTISSVTVSGTKVQLTLGSPVKYGDVVTVAYNKPSTNPLQTSTGGQAASISAQVVTNNVAAAIPIFVNAIIENATPSKLEMTYNLSLASILPSISAFTVKVNSTIRTVSSIAISGTKVTLALSSKVNYGDAVTVAYTKPSANPLQTQDGGQAATILDQNVINNCSLVINQPPVVNISSPTKSTSFTAPATITINAVASDPDGTISKVEFYNGNLKLGEDISSPYSFVWKEVTEGTYIITALATDALNAKSSSEPITVIVEKSASAVNQLPVITIKNPKEGRKFKKNEKVIIEAEASDPDGQIIKVEFKNGDVIIAEALTAPYIYVMENADTGKYIITAIATDNLGATAVSPAADFIIYDKYYYNWDPIKLYPNPNEGHFTLDLTGYRTEDRPDRVRIIEMSGKALMDDKLTDQQTYREFNIVNASAGTYVILLTKNNTVISTGKFIIK